MSVRIPVSADLSGAISTLNRLTEAHKRLQQEGKAYARANKDISDSIKQIEAQTKQLLSLREGKFLQQRLDTTGQAGKPFHEWDYKKLYADPKKAAWARAQHTAYITRGTSFEWEPPVDQTPPPGGAGGGGAGRGGMNPAMAGGMKFARGALALAGIAGIASMAHEGISEGQREAIQLDLFQRSIGAVDRSFGELQMQVRAVSHGLQLTYNETVQLVQAFSKASAASDPESILRGSREAAAFARSFGLDPGQTAQAYGKARYLGVTGERGQMNDRQFSLMMAEAISASGMWSRSDEMIGSVLRWTENSERIMVRTPDTERYAGLYSAMNASGIPGLKGALGEAVLGALDAGIRRPGAGEAGEFFMYRAIGGGLDPFKYEHLKEEGMFGSEKSAFGTGSDVTNLEKVMSQFATITGKYERMASMRGVMPGMSMHQAEAWEGVYDGHKGDPGWMNKIRDLLKAAGVDESKLNGTAIEDIGRLAYPKGNDIKDMRDKYLARGDLTDGQRSRIESAGSEAQLKVELTKVAAVLGREKNTGNETLDTLTGIKNALTEMGGEMVPALNDIRGMFATLLGSKATREMDMKDRVRKEVYGKDMTEKEISTEIKKEKTMADADTWLTRLLSAIPGSAIPPFDEARARLSALESKRRSGTTIPEPVTPSTREGVAAAAGRVELYGKVAITNPAGDVIGEIDESNMRLHAPDPSGGHWLAAP